MAVVAGTAVAVGMEVLALQDAEHSSVGHLSVGQHSFQVAGSGSIAVSFAVLRRRRDRRRLLNVLDLGSNGLRVATSLGVRSFLGWGSPWGW